jgi:hypothetical protein
MTHCCVFVAAAGPEHEDEDVDGGVGKVVPALRRPREPHPQHQHPERRIGPGKIFNFLLLFSTNILHGIFLSYFS